jgi:hypothetical protein
MFTRIYPVLENAPTQSPLDPTLGSALAKVVEIHPDIEPLLDFYSADPLEVAREVGMVYPHEEESDEDLKEVDFGPGEWYEPAAGISAVQHALAALRSDSQSIMRLIYDPTLSQHAVIRDLEGLLRVLETAQDQETRFHVATEGSSGLWPRSGR